MIARIFKTWWGADDEPTGPSDVIAAVDDEGDVDLVEDEARHVGTLACEIERWPCEILAAARELDIKPGTLPNGLATLSEEEETAIVAHLAQQEPHEPGQFQPADYDRLVTAFVEGHDIDQDVFDGVLEAASRTPEEFLHDTKVLLREQWQEQREEIARKFDSEHSN